MEYVFKINVAVSGAYDLGDGNIEQDTEEVEVYVKDKYFKENKVVKDIYAELFQDKYEMSKKGAYDLLDDYGLWFEDDELVNIILTECVDELKEEFQEEVNEAEEDFRYSRGC